MKRRILSVVLMICLLIQSVCMIAGATPAETAPAPEVPKATQDAVDFLVKLGVLDSDFDANGIATKSSFLSMALDAVKMECASADKQIFSDVPLNYYAVDAITTAYNTGYIKGNGDGTFTPDKKITTPEAAAVVMNILNYGHLEGYTSYQIIMKKQGILDNVVANADGTLNNGACAVMLYNMLLADYNMLTGVAGDAGIYESNENTNLLRLMYSIVYAEGIVTAVDEIYLDGYESVKQGFFALDGVVVEDPEGLANDMLGFAVEVFATVDEGEYTLFDINKKTRGNEEIIIEADDLTNKSTASKIVYLDENGKEKKIELAPDFTLIYNGRNYNGFTNTVFHITKGKIRVVTNNGGDYSLVYVYEYENYIIKNINYTDEKIYLENSAQVIDYADIDNVVLLDANGEPTTSDEFYTGLVVTLFKSKAPDTFLTVRAGQGDLIMVPNGMDDKYIYMDDEKVRMTPEVYANRAQLQLGTKTVFALDAFGEAFDFETVASDVMYGYLVDIEISDNAFGEIIYGVKIFTEGNEMAVFNTDEYLKVNNVKYDSTTAIGQFTTGGGACIPQLVQFSATDDNILKGLWKYTDKSGETDYVGYDDSNFTLDYVTGSIFQYREGNKSIDTKYIVNGSTLRFIIPVDGNEKNYKCTTCASGLNASTTSGVTYSLFDASKKRVASVLLEVSTTSISSFGNEYKAPVVVTDLSRGVNDDGLEVIVVKGLLDNKEVRFITDDEEMADAGETCAAFNGIKASELQCGDVVQFNVIGEENEIQAMRILYRRSAPRAYDENGFASSGTVNDRDYYAWLYAASASVSEQYDDVIIAHTNRNATEGGSAARVRVFPLSSSMQFYVYDSARNKVTKTDMSEYMIGRNVFITASLSTPRMVVIYK